MQENQEEKDFVLAEDGKDVFFNGDGIDIDEIPGIGNMSRPNTEEAKKFMM